ncbi:Gas vesicle protein [Halobacillus dabanensis]|uniref:Gas vesicle protein n=1 Tax=Halobacillus dabanensis TaxID=240302 RepID=A0A1I3RMU6_HALDA|nr:gas vesicle protein [Halobacillus dabanensis]SFJ46526.1 Gas vesicle protein [Halobacillus dabanensis]
MSHRENFVNREIALIDILDTVLDKGVAIKGDIVISIAGIDLVYLDLKVLISSVETLVQSAQDDLVSSLSSENMDREKEALARATERS